MTKSPLWCFETVACMTSSSKSCFPETELFVVRWMDLETVIQSEVSQKEKNKYRMLTRIYGI